VKRSSKVETVFTKKLDLDYLE